MMLSIPKKILLAIVLVVLIANIWDFFCRINFPFEETQPISWNKESYWYYPWGESVVHKGVDFFGVLNTEIISPVNGIVIGNAYSKRGGNYIYLLSADLKVYYFAHLNRSNVSIGQLIKAKELIGFMGDTGNAKYSPFHLHFSIYSIIPIFKYFDFKSIMGWKKIFYLNPHNYFSNDFFR